MFKMLLLFHDLYEFLSLFLRLWLFLEFMVLRILMERLNRESIFFEKF